MNHGYVLVEEADGDARYIRGEGTRVLPTLEAANTELNRIQDMLHRRARVYELQLPETIFRLSTDDVYLMAQELGISDEAIEPRMYEIKKAIEWGMEYWHDVIREAISSRGT